MADREDRDCHRVYFLPKPSPKGDLISDEALVEEALFRLARSHLIDARKITVTAAHGVLTLSGFVDSETTKRLAGEKVAEITGVKAVRNWLEIKPILA